VQDIGITAVQLVQFTTAEVQFIIQVPVTISIEKGAVQLVQFVPDVQLLQFAEQDKQTLALK
jgi:hypothetical protein